MTTVNLEDPIEVLGFDRRIFNLLKRANINTIAELIEAEENQSLASIKGIGILMHSEIQQAVSAIKIPKSPVPTATEYSRGKETDQFTEIDLLQDQINEYSKQINDVFAWQRSQIQKLFEMKLLHPNVKVQGWRLADLLEDADYPIFELMRLFAQVLNPISISEEMEVIYENVSLRNVDFLCERHGPAGKTLEQIAIDNAITRERVRQVIDNEEAKISKVTTERLRNLDDYVGSGALVKMQTALCLAEDLGTNFSMNQWKKLITETGLLGNLSRLKNTMSKAIDLFLATCITLNEKGIPELVLPGNLEAAIKLKAGKQPETTLRNLLLLKNIQSQVKKTIFRHLRYSGAVNENWLARELNLELEKIQDMLTVLGFIPIGEGWFMPEKPNKQEVPNRSEAFEHGIRKFQQYCGPIDIDSVCSATQHIVSKTNYPVPPASVMEVIMNRRGYTQEDGLWYWEGKTHEELSGGEKIILDCLRNQGPVVHHKEIEKTFSDKGYSFALIHATLRRSPLFENIGRGLYKLRGVTVSNEDILAAMQRAE